ncbi:hypothetical protein BY458DRAFT_327841 [Sporodiniella umbellata]|nr:hypothetical protein BY458DRAFT_327841 [Sporodiniella umbellata]
MWKKKIEFLLVFALIASSLSFSYFYYFHGIEEQEKFLAYLPHSGLSNQRIELANALLLAAVLQRTLIIPPAFLGSVLGWMPMEMLLDHLSWLTTPKDFEGLCQPPKPGHLSSYIQRGRCAEYKNFAAIPWTQLHDFSSLHGHIRFRFQDTVSLEKLQQRLGIGPEETYIHRDDHLYDWRLYENVTEAREILKNGTNFIDSFSNRKFYKIFTPEHWKKRPERLIQLGGIFGSTRMNMVRPEHLAIQQMITSALHYRLDTPLGETVKGIVQHVGGKATFMAIHFRVGDYPFRTNAIDNLRMFERNMSIAMGIPVPGLPPVNELGVFTSPPRPPRKPKNTIHLVPPEDFREVPWSNLCEPVSPNLTLSTAHVQSRAVVYIATDHRDMRGENSRLLEWFDFFPCTITLNDIPTRLLQPLDQMHCMYSPSKPLKQYLIPLVDAMIAAHARRIFTTPRSTFSKYIGELNEAWVLKEQGFTMDYFLE